MTTKLTLMLACLAFCSGSALAEELAASAAGAVALPAGTDSQTNAIEPVPAAYIVGPTRVPERTLAEWLENPASMLANYADGGILMSNMVRSLAGSDNRTVEALISLSNDPAATAAQRAAIGAGLARAAQGAQTAAPKYAAYISRRVAKSASAETISSFRIALTDVSTVALGFASPGASAAPGSGTVTGGGASVRGSGVRQTGSNTTPQTTEIFQIGRAHV